MGGNLEAIERVRPIIESYSAGSILVVGSEPAQATVIKLAANLVLSSIVSLFGQSYALTEGWNIDPNVTRQIHQIFTSHPGLLAYDERLRTRDYNRNDGEGFSAAGGLKDINAMIDAGKQVGVTLPFCEVTKEQCQTAIQHGLTSMDWTVLGDMPRVNAGSALPDQKKKQ